MDELGDAGYVVMPPLDAGASPTGAARTDEMAAAVRAVEARGWPPVFALMLDAPWTAIQRAWGLAGAVLGADCDLEPSIFIWSLRRNVDVLRASNTQICTHRSSRALLARQRHGHTQRHEVETSHARTNTNHANLLDVTQDCVRKWLGRN